MGFLHGLSCWYRVINFGHIMELTIHKAINKLKSSKYKKNVEKTITTLLNIL